ncbi:MAG: choice-of-anchor V domain-containing protein [Bryobacterales bacterium]|nr:choice-of-anchor V domain-containing protein [Bryobacterales bacterium]
MRQKPSFLAMKLAVMGAAAALLVYAFPTGPPAGVSGAPGETTCANCHGGGSGGGKVEIAFPGGVTYSPGVKQQWTITITDPDAQRYGFQLSARLASDNSQAGTLAPAPGESNIKVVCSNSSPRSAGGCPPSAPIEYIEHSTPGQTNTFRIEWIPPPAERGPVRIYIAANAANGNGNSSGDDIYTANYTLTPQAGQPTSGPKFTSAGVVNAASFTPGLSPGSFISIFGENLAPVTRSWDGAIQGTALPSQLEGVSVTVGGKPAYLSLVSPAQLNLLVPTDDITGPVEVKVTTPQGSSSATAVVERYAPGFFPNPLDRKYAVATHADDALVALEGQSPGVASRPAAPGEEIVLWGTGFGPTAERVPSGQGIARAYPLADPGALRVTVGGRDARVTFAGVTIPGVYQINVEMPAGLAGGDHAVQAEIGGARTQNNAFLAVRRPAATTIQVSYRLDPWLVYGTTGAGTWASPPVFGPVTQRGRTFTMPVRAQGLDAAGLPVAISPATWISSDPERVLVEPGEGVEVKLTVQRAGESSLLVASQGSSKELVIKAAYVDDALYVEIAQKP